MDGIYKASAVVLSYRRPRNVERIVGELVALDFVDEVVVWHNGPHEQPKLPMGGKCTMLAWGENKFVYARFLALRFCQHNIILTVDDDCLVKNWRAILDEHLSHPEVVTAGLTPGHYNADKNNRWRTCHEILLGWGACFDKRLVEPTLAKYIDVHGHDEILHRKADRLFTMLLNRHHNVLKADAEELPLARDDDVALYRREDHYPLTIEARRRAWKILGMSPNDGATG
jgi:hypothetical protein